MANVAHALVTVAGVELPEPSTYNATQSTLVDSARNAQGDMVGAVLRNRKSKVSLTWNYLTVKQWSDINRLFATKYEGSFINPVTFYDMTNANYRTADMYVSDRSAGMWIRDKSGKLQGWTDCKLDLIQV